MPKKSNRHLDAALFGAKIKKRRGELKMDQKTLADLVDVHQSYVSHIENGRNMPGVETLDRIFTALEITNRDYYFSQKGEVIATKNNVVTGDKDKSEKYNGYFIVIKELADEGIEITPEELREYKEFKKLLGKSRK